MASLEWDLAGRYLKLPRRRTFALHIISLVIALSTAASLGMSWFLKRYHLGFLVEHPQWAAFFQWSRPASIFGTVNLVFFIALIRRLTIFSAISTYGLYLGTNALIIVLSVMSGFEQDLEHKILGQNAHIIVTAPDRVFTEWRDVQPKLQTVKDVVGVSPYLSSEVMISSQSNLSGVVLKGIDPETVAQVTDLGKNLEQGKLDYLAHPETLKSNEGLPDFFGSGGAAAANPAPPEKKEPAKEPEGLPAFGSAPPATERPPAATQKKEPAATEKKEPAANDKKEPPTPEGLPAFGSAPPPHALPKPPPVDDEPDAKHHGEVKFEPAGAPKVVHLPALPTEKKVLPAVVIGRELAKNLRTYIGDDVNLVSPMGDIGPAGAMPRSRPFRVGGIFYSGMYEYDSKYVYMSIPAAQKFLGLDDEITGFELKVKDPEKTADAAAALRTMLGPSFEVQTWQELNRNLFSALRVEKIAMFIVLCFVILVAGFSIIANGVMLVREKGREIAILKSMGATDQSVLRAFLFVGLYMGGIGTAVGTVVGVAACLGLKYFGLDLDSDVYYISRLPVDMNSGEIAAVIMAAIAIALVATLYPALVAARLRPVDGLRYDRG